MSRDLLYRDRKGTRLCIFQVSVLAQLTVKLLKDNNVLPTVRNMGMHPNSNALLNGNFIFSAIASDLSSFFLSLTKAKKKKKIKD